jgi:hypothetical protein
MLLLLLVLLLHQQAWVLLPWQPQTRYNLL